jgi:hypothetical protein
MEVRILDCTEVLALKYVFPNILGSIFKFSSYRFKPDTSNRKEQYNLDKTLALGWNKHSVHAKKHFCNSFIKYKSVHYIYHISVKKGEIWKILLPKLNVHLTIHIISLTHTAFPYTHQQKISIAIVLLLHIILMSIALFNIEICT